MVNRIILARGYLPVCSISIDKIPKFKPKSLNHHATVDSNSFVVRKTFLNCNVVITIIGLFISPLFVSGQSSINTAGTTCIGSGGAFSSSLGQLDYTTLAGAGGTATLGVQQVYDPACQVSASITGQASLCTGSSTTLTASGGTTYIWNTGANTNTLSTTVSGTYSVTVTDAAGCTASASVSVIFSDCTIPTVVSVIQPGCSGAAAGSVVLGNLPAGSWLIEQSGTVFQTYDGTGTTYTVTGLAPGVYRFRVRNAAGAYSGLTPPFAVIIVKC